MSEPLLVAEELEKEYRMGPEVIRVLRGVTLAVNQGESVAVIGASGVGKSTLLHLIGGLDRPSGGRVRFAGEDVFSRSESALARLRRARRGRARGPPRAPARGAVRRGAAAGRHRPRAGRDAARHPGRRAHRELGSEDERGHLGSLPAASGRAGAELRDRHAQPRAGPQGGPRLPAAGRARGGLAVSGPCGPGPRRTAAGEENPMRGQSRGLYFGLVYMVASER